MRTDNVSYRARTALCWLDLHFEQLAAVAIPILVAIVVWIEICW